MPRVCSFFGIFIYMYYNDHLPPHFHAEYGQDEALYDINSLDVLQGRLPRRAHNMVIEWALLHRAELRENWELARGQQPLQNIAPLD